jgi:hypothetical protein
MTDKLNDESIAGWLKGRKGWKRSGNALTKTFDFHSFRDVGGLTGPSSQRHQSSRTCASLVTGGGAISTQDGTQ